MGLRKLFRLLLGLRPAKSTGQVYGINSSRIASSGNPLSEIEIVPEYEAVNSKLESACGPLFVTGGAGTGKSTLIRYLKETTNLNMAVAAPTGVAALNAGGTTLHSLFQLPPKVIGGSDIKIAYDRRLYRNLDLLIIDEVSMVRPDLMDGVNLFLQLNRDDSSPFGGVTLLLIGDLFQLPPVVNREEHLALRSMQYQTNFFFSSKCLREHLPATVFLRRSFRQQDSAFIHLLNDLRESRNLTSVLSALNARYQDGPDTDKISLVLTTTNAVADERNRRELTELRSKERTYMGSITGEFMIGRARLPSPMNLVMKKGAQVMFTKNDGAGRWVNGTLGRVVDLRESAVKVAIEHESRTDTVLVEPTTWDQYSYEYDSEIGTVASKVTGRYTQLPLMLAWAVTIHKAQGKTIDRVYVDLGPQAFAPGQVYVALSRVRSLADLRLARPIRREEVRCDSDVVEFYRSISG